MKHFIAPRIEVIKFELTDIITTSSGGNELPPIGINDDTNQLNITPMG